MLNIVLGPQAEYRTDLPVFGSKTTFSVGTFPILVPHQKTRSYEIKRAPHLAVRTP